jgi:general secretion pathway protein L
MGRFLGIDIGASFINVALLEVGYRKLDLVETREVAVASAASTEDAMRIAVGGLAAHADGLCVAINGDRTFTHRLTLPPTALRQVDEILKYELDGEVPVDVEDLVFSYRVLRRNSNKDPLVVLVGAARTEHVREKIALTLSALGREPDRVAHGALSLANLASVMPELRVPGPLALVDLGGSRTEVTLLSHGEPVFARTLSRGVGSLPEGAAQLGAELRQSFLAWVSKGGDEVTAAYLLGGGAAASGAEAYFAHELGVPVGPLPLPSLGAISPETAAALPRFAKAIALSLGAAGRGHDVDLRSGPLAFQRGYNFLKEKTPLLLGLGGAVVVSFLFSAWAEWTALGKELESQTAELARVTADAFETPTSDPVEALDQLAQTKNRAENDPMPQIDGFDVMVELSKAIPDTIVHDVEELDLSRGHVRLNGIVNTTADASLVRDKLSQHRCVSNAKIAKVTQVVNGTRQKYVLEFDVKCPEELPKKKAVTAAVDKPEEKEVTP